MRAVLAATILLSSACYSAVVFAERRSGSPRGEIIRVAQERGIEDLSPRMAPGPERPLPDTLVFEVPLDVRAQEEPVVLPSCAVRRFVASPRITGPDFGLEGLDLDAAPIPLALDPADAPDSTVTVQPGQRRIVPIRVVLASPDTTQSLGILIDESPGALTLQGDCLALGALGGDVVYYGFRRIVVEPAGLGAAAGVLALVAIVLVAR